MRDQNGDGISERCSGDTGGQFWHRTPSPPARLGRLGVVAPDTIPREGSCAVVRGSISMQAWLISFQVAKQSTVRIEIRPGTS